MQRELQRNNIVLLGVGHTNAHVLKMWRMKPIDGANLICVSDFPTVTYSGMLPGVLSGQYEPERMEIDLVRLCAVSGARLIVDRVNSVDTTNRELIFENRPPLRYDQLAIGIGSRPRLAGVDVVCADQLLAIKPMQTFLPRLRQALGRLERGGIPSINVVGAGVGGIEIALCLWQRLTKELGERFILRIICSSTIGKGLLPATVRHLRTRFQKLGIEVIEQRRVNRIERDAIIVGDKERLDSNLTLWATGAVASDFLSGISLPHDDRGFLLTRATLQSTGSDRVFAVGDSGTLESNPTDKAGVFAVRQGPILWNNLQNAIAGKPLIEYWPQKSYLKLINYGDGRAIAEYKGRSLVGSWAWWLKDRIDGKFMAMFQDYRPSQMAVTKTRGDNAAEMRCLGCGGKLGGLSLKNALGRLEITQNEHVIVGLQQSDDAAVVRVANNQVTVTADFFAAPFDDPFTNGRIAALNSASDCFSMNAEATTALTLAQVPLGHPRAQADVLTELLAGAQHEFKKMNVSIVGGHTIEGPRLIIGFTVLANQLEPTTRKGNLKPGDELVTTKMLGTGVLLAALMRGMCRAEWYSSLIETMTGSNQVALELIRRFGITALTDVTGFGLGGHLLEMLTASGVSAELSIDQIPVLPGTWELAELGVESSLSPENAELLANLNVAPVAMPRHRILFDPQTAGGLLLGIPDSQLDPVLGFLQSNGCPDACRIGKVVSKADDGASTIQVV